MSGSDFFDEDLRNREAARRRAPAPSPGDPPGEGSVLNRPVSDLNLTRMSRQREELEQQVAASAQELDLLRMRQEELERERRELEDLRKKQEAYLEGRRDLSDRLSQSLVMMEKEQVRAESLAELLNTHRDRFKGMQAEIASIDEASWPDDQVRDELTKTLALLDECRLEYNSAVAKIDAAMADTRDEAVARAALAPGGGAGRTGWPGFGYWLKVGLAASLPFLIALIVLALAVYYLRRENLM